MVFQPGPTQTPVDRLKVILHKTGLQQKDQPLFQLLNQLLDALRLLQVEVSGIGAEVDSGGGSTTINQQIFQLLLSEFENVENDLIIPGPQGIEGVNGMVPYFIAAGEKFTVPLYKQALFSMNIDNEGTLEIDGFLIEVD